MKFLLVGFLIKTSANTIITEETKSGKRASYQNICQALEAPQQKDTLDQKTYFQEQMFSLSSDELRELTHKFSFDPQLEASQKLFYRGKNYLNKNNFKDAQFNLLEAQKQQKLLLSNSRTTETKHKILTILSITTYNLGRAYLDDAAPSDALSLFNEALQMKYTLYGEDAHREDISKIFLCRGYAWNALNEKEKALADLTDFLYIQHTLQLTNQEDHVQIERAFSLCDNLKKSIENRPVEIKNTDAPKKQMSLYGATMLLVLFYASTIALVGFPGGLRVMLEIAQEIGRRRQEVERELWNLFQERADQGAPPFINLNNLNFGI